MTSVCSYHNPGQEKLGKKIRIRKNIFFLNGISISINIPDYAIL